MTTTLTDAQVENWRNVLCSMFGPYALIMPVEDIEAFRDRMQAMVGEPQSAEQREREALVADWEVDG